ncbi:MAG: peptidylprolyl isomerase [Thermococcus sp.]|uniref:Peptidyl-prolyl cis-trans isomerase n=1 Tax=Thermococcus guaymasensis DSM 11113 TaxID=1432656 RepID=A0A0X1KK14_9EURY|nr:peptidylprolyl isomerase [Thermococcus guaymasensis]AJC71590.1 peptidyl-prolyl cis-trans isomerase [Thermococcus guaymasensis DSM 11113]MCD6523461.1 peptidylprolyl isomerase [Thermococcus sp.]
MKVESGDFVLFNYTGRYEDGEVFDTSYEDIAKEHGIFVEDREYAPIGVTIGAGEIIPGIEEALIGMEVGEKKEVVVPPEKGYGMPREDLIVPVPIEQFTSAGLEPIEGMYVMTDAGIAKILEIGEKTVKLDFNHPLAGKTAVFEIEVVEIKKAGEA